MHCGSFTRYLLLFFVSIIYFDLFLSLCSANESRPDTPEPKEYVYTTKEEAKEAFKQLLRERVICHLHVCLFCLCVFSSPEPKAQVSYLPSRTSAFNIFRSVLLDKRMVWILTKLGRNHP